MLARFLHIEDAGRQRSLIAAILCATLCGCGFSLLMPVMSLNLEAMTGSGKIVGLFGAVAALSTVIASPFAPRLMAKIPGRRLIVIALVLTAVSHPLFPLIPNVHAWFLIRFVSGLAITIVFVSSETWINQIAPPERRATILGLYATALASGFGMGGLLLAAVGSDGWLPWTTGTLLFAIGAIPIAFLQGPDIAPPDPAHSTLRAMWGAAIFAPAAIGAGILFGATEQSFFAVFPVYGERIGLFDAQIGFMMAAGALGGIALQAILGRIADHVGRLRVALIATLVCVIGPILIYFAGANAWALYAVMFFYVGVATGLYTLGLALIGERFNGGSLAAANAAFVTAYGVGSLIGPTLGGAAMDIMDPHGLLIITSGFAVVYLAFLGVRHITRRTG
ncbi:MAG: ABC transporter permease [Hyphobacterium sp.]|nr:MAG: ABC transporter permease [Hyphobacterium sp.]